MDLKIIVNLVVLVTTMAESRSPQIYESLDDVPRKPRESISYQRFALEPAAQPDQKMWRYFKQQQADALNIQHYKFLKLNSKFPNMRKREVPVQNVNFGLNHEENVRLLQESFGNAQQPYTHIDALNSLIGKTPVVQLQGLHVLLHQKDHIPIMEQLNDIGNPNTHPNVIAEQPSNDLHVDVQNKIKQRNLLAIAQIEQDLNAAAQAQARQAFAKAQQDALAQVQEQHKKLELERAQAHQAALQNAQSNLIHGHTLEYRPVQIRQYNHAEQPKKIYKEDKENLQYASKYAFGYQVRDYHSGNDFGHEEVRNGKTAKGQYHVLLPDGRLQKVQYWADHTGFHAKVTYDRAAQHPHH